MHTTEDQQAHTATAPAALRLADKQLDALLGPHVKGDHCSIFARAEEAARLVGFQSQFVGSATVLPQLLRLNIASFRDVRSSNLYHGQVLAENMMVCSEQTTLEVAPARLPVL